MSYKRLLIWVEGEDDERFFNKIIKPKFEKKYDWVEVRPYYGGKIKNKKIRKKISNRIKNMRRIELSTSSIFDYILAVDFDFNSSRKIRNIKQSLEKLIKDIDKNRILVVIEEIESWYLAGLDSVVSKKFKIPNFRTTDTVTKEWFDDLIPVKFSPRRVFMLETLKYFSTRTARKKNGSFNYFITKYRV